LNHISGYYQKTPAHEEIVFCLDADLTERKVRVADPFQASSLDVEATIRNMNLQYKGLESIDGKPCDIIGTGNDPRGVWGSALPEIEWWIDQQSHLLTKMVTLQANDVKTVSCFSYAHINKALNFMAYMPDVSYQWVCKHKQMVGPLEEGYHRFVELQDGTSGLIDAQWGKHGPQDQESIGLR
jgi:hypothetical protein